MKLKINQFIRHVVQIISLLLFPGLFILTWSSFGEIYKLLLSGTFNLDYYVMPLLVILSVLLLTAIWGRFFCSYLCSFGFMQELLNKAGNLLQIEKLKISENANRMLKSLKYMVIVFSIILWTLDINISAYDPWEAYGSLVSLSNLKNLLSTGGLLLLVIVLFSLFADRLFCRYLCPLAGMFSVLSSRKFYKLKKSDSCVSCEKCDRVCPMGIKVSTTVNSGECINCHKCVEACPVNALSTSSSQAINGTAVSLSILGLTYMGSIIADSMEPLPVSAMQEEMGVYEDGTYTGEAAGYRGNVRVTVTVENGFITSINIESHGDNDEFFNKSKNVVINSIITSQSTEVSAVSGATYSSRGIIDAVSDALNVNDMEEIAGDRTIENNAEEETAAKSSLDFSNLADGTYSGTGKGHNGNISVSVNVSNGQVLDITITSSNEDIQYFDRTKNIVNSIIEKQSLDVSAVSGATMSGNGILEAVADALNIDYVNQNSNVSGPGRHRNKR